MSLVTLALLVSLVAVVAAIVYLVREALHLFRAARVFFRHAGEATEALNHSLEVLATKEPPDLDALSDSTARLAASQRRLSIQLAALQRVREQWGSLLAFYPRK